MGPLHELWERFGDEADFLVVYIREAHTEDGWVVSMNREADIAFDDPTSNEEREAVAGACAIRLKIRMPVVIDDMSDEIASAYGALPDRLYLIGQGGNVAYQGDQGPWGFDPKGLESAIQNLTG